MKTIIVTRHQPLVDLIIERAIAPADTPVLEHVTAEDIEGAHVIGVLPLSLASHAKYVTEVPLNLSLADRQLMASGDLSLERLREIAGQPVTYVVRQFHPPQS